MIEYRPHPYGGCVVSVCVEADLEACLPQPIIIVEAPGFRVTEEMFREGLEALVSNRYLGPADQLRAAVEAMAKAAR